MPPSDQTELAADNRMSFLSHLEELRWSIIRSLGAVAVGFCASLFFIKDLLRLLELPLARAGLDLADQASKLRTISVGESFTAIFTLAVVTGCAFAIPYVIYEIWRFVSPGLTGSEKRAIGPIVVFGTLFFYAGVAFCHLFVLPPALNYFLTLNQDFGLVAEWRLKDYMNFTLTMLFASGVLAELPVVTVILARFGIVSAPFMIHYWRHAVVGLVVVSAAITPSTDPVSMLMIAVPLIGLYGISIILAKMFYVQR